MLAIIKEILNSTITNNIIAVLSLIVSIIGLIITGCTMQSAKKIQEKLDETKINALEKSRFAEYKPKALKQIDKKLKAVQSTLKLSKNVCTEIIQVIVELKGFQSILQSEDYDLVCNLQSQMKDMATKNDPYDDSDVSNYIELLVTLKNIIEKGDYAL